MSNFDFHSYPDDTMRFGGKIAALIRTAEKRGVAVGRLGNGWLLRVELTDEVVRLKTRDFDFFVDRAAVRGVGGTSTTAKR